VTLTSLGKRQGALLWGMPLASLRCRPARFDDERLNYKVEIATLKISVLCIKNGGTLVRVVKVVLT